MCVVTQSFQAKEEETETKAINFVSENKYYLSELVA